MSTTTLQRRAGVSLDTYIVDASWSSDSRSLVIAGGEGDVVLVQDARTAPAVRVMGEHGLGVLAVAWQPGIAGAAGNNIASSGQDGSLVLWDANTTEPRKRLRPGAAWTEHLAYSPNGKLLAASTGKSLGLWSSEGELLREYASHPTTIAALAWDKPGRDIAVAAKGVLSVHKPETPNAPELQYKCDGACLTAAYSPNGKVLATSTQEGGVYFWYLSSGRNSRMQGYGAKVSSISWSGNSRYLATSATEEIVVWDFSGKGPEGSKPLQLKGHTEKVDSVAFQPNGPWLVSGGRDWRVSLWLPGKVEHAVDVHLASAPVSCLKWSPDGKSVAVGEANGKLTVYELLTS